MAAYVVHTRIDGIRPRRAERRPQDEAEVRHVGGDQETTELERGEDAGWDWERIREVWAQTTFYLFDPSSWR
jgi:hypothetical protein